MPKTPRTPGGTRKSYGRGTESSPRVYLPAPEYVNRQVKKRLAKRFQEAQRKIAQAPRRNLFNTIQDVLKAKGVMDTKDKKIARKIMSYTNNPSFYKRPKY